MPKHQYLEPGYLFEGDNDEDEYSANQFRNRTATGRPIVKITSAEDRLEQKQQQDILKKIQDVERRTLESAANSLRLLDETTDIGNHAATQLLHQGEQLENANAKLDQIDSHLKQSQRDINGIKSVFYGLKNAITGKSRSPSPSPSERSISPHRKTPKMKCKFFASSTDREEPKQLDNFDNLSLHSPDNQSLGSSSSEKVNKILDENLGQMSQHLSQLKEFSLKFGEEVDRQNELMDTIQNKVEHSDIKMKKQNKDMRKILGK